MSTKLTKVQEKLFSAITSRKQQITAVNYIAGGYKNKTQAYLDMCEEMEITPADNANVAASTALGYDNVQAFINSVKFKAAKNVNVDAQFIMNAAAEVLSRCMQHEPVMVNGEPTGEYKFDAAGANKAIDTLGKLTAVAAFNDAPVTQVVVQVQRPLADRLKGKLKDVN